MPQIVGSYVDEGKSRFPKDEDGVDAFDGCVNTVLGRGCRTEHEPADGLIHARQRHGENRLLQGKIRARTPQFQELRIGDHLNNGGLRQHVDKLHDRLLVRSAGEGIRQPPTAKAAIENDGRRSNAFDADGGCF